MCESKHWFSCGADGRSVGGRCTVTWLPNFLGWVDLLSHGAPTTRACGAPLLIIIIDVCKGMYLHHPLQKRHQWQFYHSTPARQKMKMSKHPFQVIIYNRLGTGSNYRLTVNSLIHWLLFTHTLVCNWSWRDTAESTEYNAFRAKKSYGHWAAPGELWKSPTLAFASTDWRSKDG